MKTNIRKLFLAIFAVVLVATTFGLQPSNNVYASTAASAYPNNCWCTKVVATHFGLPMNYPNARDFGPWLQKYGFKLTTNPVPGDVAVFTAINHVGVLQTISSEGNKWHFTLLQNVGTPDRSISASIDSTVVGRRVWAEKGCPNVGVVAYAARAKNDSTIKYYHR